MVTAASWDWSKSAATVDRGSRRITTPDQTGVQKLHHQIATRDPQEYHDILSRSTGGAANTEMHEAAQFLRDFSPKDKKLRGAVNATKLDAVEGFKGVPARGRTIPAQPGYQAFHEGFQAGQLGEQLPRSVMQPGAYPKPTPSPTPKAQPQASSPTPKISPPHSGGAPAWVGPAAVGAGIAIPLGVHAFRRHQRRKQKEERKKEREQRAQQPVPA